MVKQKNDDFGAPIPALPEPKSFAVASRMPSDLVWAESVQYDAYGRNKVEEHIRSTTAGALKSAEPEAGWVSANGTPCGEFNATARPVWIWYTA